MSTAVSAGSPDAGLLRDRRLRAAIALAVTVAVVLGARTVLAAVAGWPAVLALLGSLAWPRLLVLAAIWFGGLAVYSTVLSAALPGLGMRRSLLLNLSGSAVANLVPLGGALATGLNWRMVRSWGHSTRAFGTFCVLTNALDVLTKLLLPLLAVGLLVVGGTHVPVAIWALAAACGVVLALAATVFLRVGSTPPRLQRWVLACRSAFRARPVALSVGSAAYLAAQVLLLSLSLAACGLHPGLAVLLTCAALERLATLVPLTPGGVGVAELGAVAWLVASGLDPVGAVAGVLLYRVFIVGMEVPVGALLLVGWGWRRAVR